MRLLVIIIIAIGLSACNTENNASYKQMQKYEKRFINGDRDTAFLKTLLAELDRTVYLGIDLNSEQVTDAYLCTFPVEERYANDYLKMFIQDISNFQLKSYQELIVNWDMFNETSNSDQLRDKIETDGFNYAREFISSYTSTLEVPAGYSFKEVQDAFSTIKVDNLDKKVMMMQILQHATKANVPAMIDIVEKGFINENYYPKSFSYMLIYAGCQRLILDLSSKPQCIRMLRLLSSEKELGSKSPYKQMLHDLEGKKMYLEYYEQNK
ncbi:MAG: hypothetical protein ABFS10_11030 [Bacteroidota bacterium]